LTDARVCLSLIHTKYLSF